MSIDEQGSKNDEVFPWFSNCHSLFDNHRFGEEYRFPNKISPLERGKALKTGVPGFMAEGCVEGSGSPEVVAK